MHIFVMQFIIVISTVYLTMLGISHIDMVPHEQPMIEFCEQKHTQLKYYNKHDFTCSDGGQYNKDVLKD